MQPAPSLHPTRYSGLRPLSRAGEIELSDVVIYIHAVVENSNHNNRRLSASSAKDDLAAFAEFSVARPHILGLPARL